MRRWLLIVLGLLIITGGLGWFARHLYFAPGPLPEDRTVVVPHGSVQEVAVALSRAGVIGARTWPFAAASFATVWEGPIHAAELTFPAHANLATVLDVLRFGRPVLHKFTIAEGLTSAQVALLLAQADWLAGDVPVPPEGSLLPQTYAFERGTPRRAVIARAQTALRAALAAAWPGRAPGLPLRTKRDAVILASIVERETALPAERKLIAGVFYNRLRLGMRLQSDPTEAYAASGGAGPLGRALDRADLAQADPYNTYVVSGLPSGPICNPGLASIEAVLHPEQTEALYFVADGHGGHTFATSLAAHDRNIERGRRR